MWGKNRGYNFYLKLTQREREVANFLKEGYTLREIGKKLGISHVSVLNKEKIKKNLLDKM
ncbi:MAG: LuxR C-terminal-related transcriptional regulator [bacterium]